MAASRCIPVGKKALLSSSSLHGSFVEISRVIFLCGKNRTNSRRLTVQECHHNLCSVLIPCRTLYLPLATIPLNLRANYDIKIRETRGKRTDIHKKLKIFRIMHNTTALLYSRKSLLLLTTGYRIVFAIIPIFFY